MPTTKIKLAEQVQRIRSRSVDRENLDPVLYRAEALLAVEQSINKVLHIETINANRYGNSQIPQSSLIKYSVAVASNKATLPAFPLNLVNGMGVWEIVNPSDSLNPYIPVPASMAKMLGDTIASGIEGQVGYFQYGDVIEFLSDVADGNYDFWLLTSDFSKWGDNDPLPLSSSYELDVINMALQTFGLSQLSQSDLQSLNNLEDIQMSNGNQDNK